MKFYQKSVIFDGFWRFFEVHSILAQYYSIELPNPSLVDNGASFDTPGVPGGVQISGERNIFDFSLCIEEIHRNRQSINLFLDQKLKGQFVSVHLCFNLSFTVQ